MTDYKPISECYWVEPGRVLAGEHPGHWDETLARRRLTGLLDAGITAFIDLSAPGDVVRPYLAQLEKVCGDRGVVIDYISHPLPDGLLPDEPDEIAAVLRSIHAAVAQGERVYVHCSDGVGRTGMIVGCWLVERGFDPEDALDELARRYATMNKAKTHRVTPSTREQAEWVENWEPLLGLRHQRSQVS
jgi:hypothetical protein